MTCLPDLSKLSIADAEKRDDAEDRHALVREWHALCGSRLPSWVRFGSSAEKKAFRLLADRSENDRFSAGQYQLPYSGDDVDTMFRDRTWSIEHVLPRSLVNGRAPGAAEDDPFGWDVATRSMNSKRSNLPLVLWDAPAVPVGRVDIGGVPHFNPLAEHRDRLARRWLYLRATYAEVDALDPPSAAQRAHADAIVALVARSRLSYAEGRLHGLLEERVKEKYGVEWSNPLCERERDTYGRALALAARIVFGPRQKLKNA
jgi:hypothetical protein